jgi:hypothetical protein
MVAELAPSMHDFLPSCLFMSLHMEMFLVHTPPTRDINYLTVRRDDPHINRSYWAETFPAIHEWYVQERALTPGKWCFCNCVLSFWLMLSNSTISSPSSPSPSCGHKLSKSTGSSVQPPTFWVPPPLFCPHPCFLNRYACSHSPNAIIICCRETITIHSRTGEIPY